MLRHTNIDLNDRISDRRTALLRAPLLIAAAGAALLAVTTAGASTRITKGDAQAVLQAFGNGGLAVINHNSEQQVGPGDIAATIRPFAKFDGRHYCSLDWHTIVVADIEGGDSSFTQPQAQAIISTLGASFYLDGQALQVTQTPVKHFDNTQALAAYGVQVAYYSQWGQVQSPSSLTVGSHSLRGVLTSSGQSIFDNTITFYVDPANSSTCS